MLPTSSRRAFLHVLAAGGIGSIAGCVGGVSEALPLTDQPANEPRQFQYDAQNTCVTGSGPPTDGTLRWRVRRDELGSDGESIDGLAAQGDHLVVTTKAAIHSLDPSDGSERWRNDPGYDGGTPMVSPALSNDTVYVAWQQDQKGGLSAIDLSDGSERWRSDPVGKVTSNPTLVEETLYVSVLQQRNPQGGAIIAVNTATGSLRWQFSTAQMPPTPAVANGTVYVGGGNEGIVYALDAETGEKIWETSTPDWMRLPATVVEGTVYIPSDFARKVYALDAEDGTKQWNVDMLVSASVAATSESIYVPVMDEIVILAADGTERWTQTVSESTLSSAPVVAGQSLVVPGESAVCLDLTVGTRHWEQTVEKGTSGDVIVEGISCEPVVTDSGVFLGTPAGDIYAIGE